MDVTAATNPQEGRNQSTLLGGSRVLCQRTDWGDKDIQPEATGQGGLRTQGTSLIDFAVAHCPLNLSVGRGEPVLWTLSQPWAGSTYAGQR